MWQNVLGHDSLVEKFRRASSRGRLSGSFLFVGPGGIGKRKFAHALAKSLLCEAHGPDVLDACGNCDSCLMFPGHPDFFTVGKPEENSFIPLELLIGSKDHRGKEGLCYEISRTPFRGGRKIAVIDDADFLNAEGANSLLKTLEEPPSDSLLILIGTSAGKQLPTIRSRCQLIRFSPLSGKNLARILYENEEVESLEAGMKIAVHAEGNCTTARELMDDSLESFRAALQHDLSRRTHAGTALAAKIVEFVEAVGKETRLRRNRLRIVFSMVLQHDRTALEKLKSEEFEAVKFYVRRIDKTLDALAQIDRNITATLIVEDWAVF